MRRSLVRFAPLLALLWAGLAASAPARWESGEVLVKFRPDAAGARRAALMEDLGATRLESFAAIGVERLRVSGDVEAAVARLSARPEVAWAEPNYIWSIEARPNDPLYVQQWALHNTGQTGGTAGADIHAEPAWDLYRGDPELLVGVIDSGVDWRHPDLAANLWTNPGEIPGNGVDDDGNGWVDDVHGYDFANRDGDPFDDNGHGTHVSGTIAAVGNNGIGVTGVNWHAKIVALKFLRSNGSGNTADALAALQYATALGIRVVNNSWGGGFYSQAMSDAIAAAGAAGMVFVAAAGNSGLDSDLYPQYPAAYDLPNVISVAATDRDDQLASFSNWGATSVDLAAPGVDVLSTIPSGGYQVLSGTSMASPHVTGACAILIGRHPDIGPLQVRARILAQADRLPALAGRCVTGARLNLFLSASDPDTIMPGAITDLRAIATGSSSADLAWTATGDDGTQGAATQYEMRWSRTPFDAAGFPDAVAVRLPAPAPAGAAEQSRVFGLPIASDVYVAVRARDEFGNPGPLSNVVHLTTLAAPRAVVTPASLAGELRTGEVLDAEVTIHNDSPGTLEWRAPAPTVEVGAFGPGWPQETLAKGEEGAARGEQSQSFGGPDPFGYRWLDSNEPHGPRFEWVDVASPANQVDLVGDDALSGALPMNFSFPFYGHRYAAVRVCTNGYLTFGEDAVPFVNSGLPSTRGVRTMLAPFWDDLNFGAAARRAYAYGDGARFVVTWLAVPRYSDPSSVQTFQAILYPSGEIRFQYLTLTGVRNNCTVGIQDTTRALGLTVSFNQDYLRDSLAVRVVPLRQWLTASPDSGFLQPGQSSVVQVRFDAASLATGDYAGALHLLTNDPLAADVSVTAAMHVDGAPDAVFGPASLDFGEVFVGAADTLLVTVANTGVDDLRLLWNLIGPPFTTVFTPDTLAPGDVRVFPVVFAPVAPGDFDRTLDIACDDPDLGLLRVQLHGHAAPPPLARVEPASLALVTANGMGAGVRDRITTLRLRNDGASPLRWTAIPVQATGAPAGGPAASAGFAADGALGAGGPDGGGYRWIDSDAPGGPVFEWQEISGVGMRLFGSADDSTRCDLPLPFDFPFYGGRYRSVNVCTNGWLSFGSRGTSFRNGALPDTSASAPRNLVAPWWDDLDLRTTTGGGRAYAHFDGTRFIVEWRDAVHYAVGGPYSFQAILWPNGTIEFQYLAVGAPGNQATIGLQDSSGLRGTTIVKDAAYAHAGLRVRLQRSPDWLAVQPAAGELAPHEEDTLLVTMSALEQDDGEYRGELRLLSNDVVRPVVAIPARMRTGMTVVALDCAPRVIGSLARSPEILLAATTTYAASELDTATARWGGFAPSAAARPAGPGRVELPFRALDWVAAGVADGAHGTLFQAVAGERTWLSGSVLLDVSRPPLEVVGLPRFGAGEPPVHAMSGNPLSLSFAPPALVDHYEAALSLDFGLHWTLLASTPGPGWSFTPEVVSAASLVEISAWHGDSLTGVWLSAPFVVEGPPGTGVDEERVPERFAVRVLGQGGVTPRPRLALDLPLAAEARLDVYDVRGARVRTLARGRLAAGVHEFEWDGRDGAGQSAAPGVYFARAVWGGRSAVGRVVLSR